MSAFSLNSRTGLAFIALVVVSELFALSRMPGGIGGTGISPVPGGIGGTGIYGRIDAFGSIWVNGVEVFYDEDQNVIRQGRDGLPERLAIGQMVAVTLDEVNGRAEAKTIEIVEEVSGPVTSVNDDQIEIVGQLVLLSDDTVVDLPQGRLNDATHLAISGYRSGTGQIIASHIAVPLVADEVSLRGKVDQVDEETFWVGGQEIQMNDKKVVVGEEVEIRGVLNTEVPDRPILQPLNFEAGENILFDQSVTRRLIKTVIMAPLSQVDENFADLEIAHPDLKPYNIGTIEVELEFDVAGDLAAQKRVLREIRPVLGDNFGNMWVDTHALRRNVRRIQEEASKPDNAGRTIIIQTDPRPEPVAEEPQENIEQPSVIQEQQQQPRRAELVQRRQEEIERRRAALLENEQLRERIEARRRQLQAVRLQAANQRRLIAVEARRQALIEARRQLQEAQQLDRDQLFEAGEMEQMLRDGNMDRETFRQIQRNIRDRVQGEIRDGARLEAREEIRKRIREEIRRRIRRQLREQ